MTQAQLLVQPLAPQHDPPTLVDTHVHLDDRVFDQDRDEVVARSRQTHVGIVLMSTDLNNAERVIALAKRHGLTCAIGVHPNTATTADDTLESTLKERAQEGEVVALGEIGLDYYRDNSPRALQHAVLRRQLALALTLDLPVVLHNRQATDDLLSIVKEFRGLKGVFHSFMGDTQEADAILELGFFLGLGGSLTFKKNEPLRQTVRQLPLSSLLLETDSPYLTPVPLRGRRNEPAYVRHVANTLAQIRDDSIEHVASQTSANARRLFGR